MSAVTIIAGIACAAMFSGVIFAWWHGHRDLFSILFVASIATLAVAITYARVGRHSDQDAATEAVVRSSAIPASGMLAGPATVLPLRAATMKALSGSAARPTEEHPHTGYP